MALLTHHLTSPRSLLPFLVTGALMLAGCGHAENLAAAATMTATTTPTAINLTWQAASPVLEGATAPMLYAPAPSDGLVAYACGSTGSGATTRALIWKTGNAGRSWSKGVALPYSGPLSYCSLIVDANDPQRVSVWLNTAKMGASPNIGNVVSYLSQDGGATWRTLPKGGPYIMLSMASSGNVIYASGSGLSASGADLRDVWVSRDGGRSWRALEASELSPNPLIWANPQTGELLGTNNYDLVPTLWRSENGGASWAQIKAPNVAGAGGGQSFIVAPNGAGWRICATGTTAPGPNEKNALACSVDLGATWASPIGLNPSQQSPKGFTFTASSDVFAIANDGSLLASYDDINSGIQFEMLAPGASAWTPLSDPPVVSSTGGEPVYTSGPGGGMLWVSSGNTAHPFATAIYP
jgi:photosystem II stability/assembly factor-like uncharacterized protein